MKPKNIVQAKPHTNDGSLSEIKYFVKPILKASSLLKK
jgi:hypothetical protein|tara:strand:- start:455 stop:568 length:114 start_codon:yes stop_codon:yes gene_type:complete